MTHVSTTNSSLRDNDNIQVMNTVVVNMNAELSARCGQERPLCLNFQSKGMRLRPDEIVDVVLSCYKIFIGDHGKSTSFQPVVVKVMGVRIVTRC